METIITSAGSVGAERRSYERLYITGAEPVVAPSGVVDTMRRLDGIIGRRNRQVSRAVLRIITTDEVIDEAIEAGYRPEVIAPLDYHDTKGSRFAIFATADVRRSTPIAALGNMLDETYAQRFPISVDPIQGLRTAIRSGYRFTERIESDAIPSLYDLWGTTFEWSKANIEALQARLLAQETAGERSLWFAATAHESMPDQLVSAAMAERINIQGMSRLVPLVESTEWRTRSRPGQPKGLIVPVITRLNQQISMSVDSPFVIAECNFASRADRRGHQAGFIIPRRDRAAQVLVQNVAVMDEIGEWPLRDFTFMTLPTPQDEMEMFRCA